MPFDSDFSGEGGFGGSAIGRCCAWLVALFRQVVLGLTAYIWRSSDDGKVRASHQDHDDRRFEWDNPPEGGHPGEAFGCRCFAEPVVEDVVFPDGAVCERVNGGMLAKVFPQASEELRRGIADEIDLQIVTGKLNSPERLAHFFAQSIVEVGPKTQLEEGFDYSPSRLLAVFPTYFDKHPGEEDELGRTLEQDANQEEIANRLYAGRNGNGDRDSGDGFRFRGRGLLHLTGRANYRRFADLHESVWGEFIDFEIQPDLLIQPRYAVRSAVGFWLAHSLHLIADEGVSPSVADKITRVVTGGKTAKVARSEKLTDLYQSGVFANVCRFSVSEPRFSQL